jgi:hypothetical protein
MMDVALRKSCDAIDEGVQVLLIVADTVLEGM